MWYAAETSLPTIVEGHHMLGDTQRSLLSFNLEFKSFILQEMRKLWRSLE